MSVWPAFEAAAQPQAPNVPAANLVYSVEPVDTDVALDGRLRCVAQLANKGDRAIIVYWGDYALPGMYRFDVRHEESGLRLPATRLSDWPAQVPRAAPGIRFVTIAPGQSVSYDIYLSSSPASNGQRVLFRRPGKYIIEPSLRVTTDQALDRETGELTDVPGAWTGALEAPPFMVTVQGNEQSVNEGIRITGAVFSEDGRGVADALVQVHRPVRSAASFDWYLDELADQALTDASGRFEFIRLPAESSSFKLEARHADYSSAEATVNNDGRNREYDTRMVLSPGVAVSGRVVDQDGAPVAEARLNHRGRYAWSDAEGNFTLAGLPQADEYGFSIWRPGYLTGSVSARRDLVTSGDWRITVLPAKAVTVTGRAQFPDGTAVTNAKVQFQLTPTDPEAPEPRFRGTDVKTDASGGFQLVLPEAREYSAIASAYEPPPAYAQGGYSDMGRIWKKEAGNVAPGSDPMEIIFENRGRLDVELTLANELPEWFEWVVTCSLERENRVIDQTRLPVDRKNASFDRLGPGKYRVQVASSYMDQLSWSATVELTGERIESPMTVTIDIPEIRFGSVTARFVMPDGQTPYRNGMIWPGRGTHPPITDDDGRLRLLNQPVGRMWLTPRAEGIAPIAVEVEVAADQTTDLGEVRLRSIDEEYGEVWGRITYEDGTPALGAACASGDNMRFPGPGTLTDLYGTPVKADGGFHVRLRAGTQHLSFNLAGASGWPNPRFITNSAGTRFLNPSDNALTRVNVRAGEKIEHNIVLRRGVPRSIKIRRNLPEGARAHLMAFIQQGDVRISRMLPGRSQNDVIEIEHLPQGQCAIVLRADSSGPQRYYAVKEVVASVGELVFDAADVGSLEVRVARSDGNPVRGLGMELRAEAAGQEFPVWSVRAAPVATSKRSDPLPAQITERDDGMLVFAGLGPGNYRVRVTTPAGATHEGAIEIENRQTATLQWRE